MKGGVSSAVAAFRPLAHTYGN